MFAYCQYKDAIGEGLGHKWGNWTGTLAKSNTALKNPKTDETLSAADILKMFEEQSKLTSQELKGEMTGAVCRMMSGIAPASQNGLLRRSRSDYN